MEIQTRAKQIKAAIDRKVNAIRSRPYIASGTARTRVELNEGLRCTIEEGQWSLTTDTSTKSGGDDTGPNPGILARGALGSCLAVGYQMWASRLGIPIDHLAIEVEADYDARGEYGVADVHPGYLEVRYSVRIDSPASEEDVRRLIEVADEHSSILDVFARAIHVKRTATISKTAE